MRLVILTAALALIACEGTKDGDDTAAGTIPTSAIPTGATGGGGTGGGGTGGTSEIDCADPAVNPYAGTCVEDYLAGCFDPSGPCDGVFDMAGNVELTWENGAQVITTSDFSDPFNITVTTEIYSSAGDLCATGLTENMTGSCASETVYARTSDGASLGFCAQTDGSLQARCDDGTTIDVTAEDSAAAGACQYSGDAEACDVSAG